MCFFDIIILYVTYKVFILSANMKGRGPHDLHYKDILNGSGLIKMGTVKPKMMPHMHVVGIAKLSPGTVCTSAATAWDAEERLLWACFRYADDVASLHVLDYARLV